MATTQERTAMVEPRHNPHGRQRAIHLSTRPNPSVRHGNKGAITTESLTLGEKVSLTVYPRYFLRRYPWLAEGIVYAIDERGVTLTRTIHGFGKPFLAGYYIPMIYFEEGRVFRT